MSHSRAVSMPWSQHSRLLLAASAPDRLYAQHSPSPVLSSGTQTGRGTLLCVPSVSAETPFLATGPWAQSAAVAVWQLRCHSPPRGCCARLSTWIASGYVLIEEHGIEGFSGGSSLRRMVSADVSSSILGNS